MTNPKGRVEENRIVQVLTDAGFEVEREGKRAFSSDIVGLDGWTIEVKHRKTWRTFEWVRKARRASTLHGTDWVIFASHGDRRTREGSEVGTVAILDYETFISLLGEA